MSINITPYKLHITMVLQKIKRIGYAVGAISLFIMALQLLSTSTGDLTPVLEQSLKPLLDNDLNSLGAGWITAYLTLNGTTGAAIGLSLFHSGIITSTQLLTMLSGSRLAAAFVVILIGVLEYFQGKADSIKDSTSIGMICFLIAYTIYTPAIMLSYFYSKNFPTGFLNLSGPAFLQNSLLSVFTPATNTIASITGPGLGFFVAIGLLILALRIFGLAFNGLNAESLRGNYLQYLMGSKWIAFATGSILTLLTTSVSLSLGIIVPLYNEGFIKRQEIIPYIMGANLATMISFVISAMIVGTKEGMAQVLVLTGGIFVITTLALIFYKQYFQLLQKMFDALVTRTPVMIAFIVTLVAVPLAALLI
ncbi:MAG: sodium-dependent phosphate cotransporter [Colwellia polaris]|jgi:sodium-dependent phosphate cotransporter